MQPMKTILRRGLSLLLAAAVLTARRNAGIRLCGGYAERRGAVGAGWQTSAV